MIRSAELGDREHIDLMGEDKSAGSEEGGVERGVACDGVFLIRFAGGSEELVVLLGGLEDN